LLVDQAFENHAVGGAEAGELDAVLDDLHSARGAYSA
jgi:hypothetical protein